MKITNITIFNLKNVFAIESISKFVSKFDSKFYLILVYLPDIFCKESGISKDCLGLAEVSVTMIVIVNNYLHSTVYLAIIEFELLF